MSLVPSSPWNGARNQHKTLANLKRPPIVGERPIAASHLTALYAVALVVVPALGFFLFELVVETSGAGCAFTIDRISWHVSRNSRGRP
jgi:hypothetical protein